jgi:hypothetical protein
MHHIGQVFEGRTITGAVLVGGPMLPPKLDQQVAEVVDEPHPCLIPGSASPTWCWINNVLGSAIRQFDPKMGGDERLFLPIRIQVALVDQREVLQLLPGGFLLLLLKGRDETGQRSLLEWFRI